MTPFVGRVEELETLGEIVGVGEHGGTAAAVIVGDPGSGKSRLLAEAAARAAALPTHFRVVGYEPEAEVPFASAADFLKTIADANPRRRIFDALLLGTETNTPALEPLRVFESAHRALSLVGPTLILVDDVQWVDDLSLALLHYLVRAADATGQSLALIAVARPSANATSLAASLGQL